MGRLVCHLGRPDEAQDARFAIGDVQMSTAARRNRPGRQVCRLRRPNEPQGARLAVWDVHRGPKVPDSPFGTSSEDARGFEKGFAEDVRAQPQVLRTSELNLKMGVDVRARPWSSRAPGAGHSSPTQDVRAQPRRTFEPKVPGRSSPTKVARAQTSAGQSLPTPRPPPNRKSSGFSQTYRTSTP